MKKGTFCILLGILLILTSIGLTGYNMWDDNRAGVENDAVLEQLLPQINIEPIPANGRNVSENSNEIEYPDYVLNKNASMPVKPVKGKNYVGVLSIPVLNRSFPVLSEWSYPNLKTSPCLYTGTAYLGNMVICAHNYNRHFGLIKNLKYGDRITFTDMDGNVFTYEVIEVETLQPTAVEEMTSGDWDLTLFTCTIGGATRVTVRCALYE